MPSIQEIAKRLADETQPISIILMSRPGMGKTTLASSFPRPRYFDFDKKMGAILNPDWIKKLGGKVPQVEYETFAERSRNLGLAVQHNAFDDACRYFDRCMSPAERGKFDTFVVDSVTNMTEAAYNKALIVLQGAKRSYTHESAVKTGMAILQKQDFGGGNSLVMQFLRMLLDSGKNVIAIVHEKETTNDTGLLVSIDPMLIGQNTQAVPALFQNVWRLKVIGVPPNQKRQLICDTDGIVMARSEIGLGTIEEPTYDKIRARIRERVALVLANSPEGTPSLGGTQPPLAVAK